MWIVLLLFLLQTGGFPNGQSPCPGVAPAPSGAPTFIVQAVDPYWQPISGAQVTVRLELNGKEEKTEYADAEGYAKFWFATSPLLHVYAIEVNSSGFKKAELKHVPFPSPGPGRSAYVQLRLELKPGQTVTVE
jgi:hypothetical protein